MVKDFDFEVFGVNDFKFDLIFNMTVTPDLVQVTQVPSDLFVIYES